MNTKQIMYVAAPCSHVDFLTGFVAPVTSGKADTRARIRGAKWACRPRGVPR